MLHSQEAFLLGTLMSHNVFSEVAFLFLAWYQGVEVAFSSLLAHIYLLCKSALADESISIK